MTNLESFECPNCGAKVKRPEPGKTAECPFCATELEAPEPAPPVVVREIVRERVIEQAPPLPDFRARTRTSVGTRVALGFGILIIALISTLVMASNARQDEERRAAKDQAEAACEQRCKPDCERQYPKPAPAPPGSSFAGTSIEDLNAQAQKYVGDSQREANLTICESDCTRRCLTR